MSIFTARITRSATSSAPRSAPSLHPDQKLRLPAVLAGRSRSCDDASIDDAGAGPVRRMQNTD
jgi:hypothetical protein